MPNILELNGDCGTESTVHILPCEIDHNGPAKVSTYFVVEKPDGPAGSIIDVFRI